MDIPSHTIIDDINFLKRIKEFPYNAFKHKAIRTNTIGIKEGGKVAYIVVIEERDIGLMTTTMGIHVVRRRLGLESTLEMPEIKGGIIPKSAKIFDQETYFKIASAGAAHGYNYPLYSLDGSKLNIGVVIVLMMSFKGYSLHYEAYFADPDDNVEIIENEQKENGETSANIWAGSIGMQRDTTAHSLNKLKTMAYLMCFFMTKTTSVPGQYEAVVTKRLEAFSAAAGYEDMVGKASEIIELMPESLMNRLSKSIHFYPKLKTNIFAFLLYSNGPEFSHMSEIFKESQLTIFNIVYQFLTSEQVTKLHIHPRVLTDRVIWMEIFKKIYEKYGQNWPYYKLYEPRSLETAVSRYPTLASAALSFAAVNDMNGTVQLGRLAGRVKAIETFKKFARLHAPQSILKGGHYQSAKDLIESLSGHTLIPLRFDSTILEDNVAWEEVEAESSLILK